MAPFVLLCSGQLFCPSVAGEPPCCCDGARGQLRAIRNSMNGSWRGQPTRGVWAVCDGKKPPVPSLPCRKGARHDQTVGNHGLPSHVSSPSLSALSRLFFLRADATHLCCVFGTLQNLRCKRSLDQAFESAGRALCVGGEEPAFCRGGGANV
jgi:hypothetical protein